MLYGWLTSPHFLAPKLVPEAMELAGAPSDTPEDVLQALSEEARIFHFHLNCTVTTHFPSERARLVRELHEREIATVNASVTDISKRHVHRVLEDLGIESAAAGSVGEPGEPIFVKTDLNFGGDSEWALEDSERSAMHIPQGSRMIYNPNHYQVLRRDRIPAAWWADPTLVLERYIENPDDLWYRCFVRGDRMVLCELENAEQVKKVGDSTLRRSWSLSPGEEPEVDSVARRIESQLRAFVPRLEFDFGAIDLVVDGGGQPYIIDVNTTPAFHHELPGVLEGLAPL